MAGSQKKVVVRSFGGEVAWGYLPSGGFLAGEEVELMDPAGRLKSIPLNGIQWIAYVRDFNLDDRNDPEHMGRKTFLGRPRSGGLWLRLRLRDDAVIEGLSEFDLAALGSVVEDGGLMLTPPDGRGNTLRLFVPRAALKTVEVLGWISSAPKPPKKVKVVEEGQPGLFGEDA